MDKYITVVSLENITEFVLVNNPPSFRELVEWYINNGVPKQLEILSKNVAYFTEIIKNPPTNWIDNPLINSIQDNPEDWTAK
ncbi:hypothetical protein V2P53_00985 [Mycoplasma capricolum subsp. capricolum]|uniref:hypothetical protein n=1 Tax=Mycoplasma capricolum TaxID=2095 RepID=UPI003DA1F171